MKKQSNLSRLLEIAGSHKYLTYASWVLSAISALIALVPFYYIWKMIKEVLEVAPNFDQAQNLTGNGWMAVLFAVIAVLVYIAGLMCSHLGHFVLPQTCVSRPWSILLSCLLGLPRVLAAENCARSSTNPAQPPKPISPISFPTEPMPLQPPAVFWCCCSCLTGDWDC